MREITTRKEYECLFCERTIVKGSRCLFDKGKSARYDDNDKQVGIHFWQAYFCLDQDECNEPLKKPLTN